MEMHWHKKVLDGFFNVHILMLISAGYLEENIAMILLSKIIFGENITYNRFKISILYVLQMILKFDLTLKALSQGLLILHLKRDYMIIPIDYINLEYWSLKCIIKEYMG